MVSLMTRGLHACTPSLQTLMKL